MERGEGVLAHGLDGAPKESPRSGKPRAKLWCPRGRSCSRVDTALRGEVGAGRRCVPTVATSLPRSEPSRRLREARWQRSVSQKTTPTWVDSHGVARTPSPLRARWQSRRRSLQDPQRSSYLSFGLLLFRCVLSTDFGTSMPSMSAEESIPSLDGRSTNQGYYVLRNQRWIDFLRSTGVRSFFRVKVHRRLCFPA